MSLEGEESSWPLESRTGPGLAQMGILLGTESVETGQG